MQKKTIWFEISSLFSGFRSIELDPGNIYFPKQQIPEAILIADEGQLTVCLSYEIYGENLKIYVDSESKPEYVLRDIERCRLGLLPPVIGPIYEPLNEAEEFELEYARLEREMQGDRWETRYLEREASLKYWLDVSPSSGIIDEDRWEILDNKYSYYGIMYADNWGRVIESNIDSGSELNKELAERMWSIVNINQLSGAEEDEAKRDALEILNQHWVYGPELYGIYHP